VEGAETMVDIKVVDDLKEETDTTKEEVKAGGTMPPTMLQRRRS